MDSNSILIVTFCSLISGCLICVCFKYYKDRQKQLNERNKLKRIHDNLKRKNIIIPISDNEETKDERENQVRTAELTNNEENV